MSRARFCRSLRRYLDGCPTCPPGAQAEILCEKLFRHYELLRRWNRRVSLIGPGTASDVVERHYGESLAAYGLIRDSDRVLVDVGSGAGFPGLILAAACSELDVILVEPRERKCHFLKAASRHAELCCRCLNARVELSLPADLPEQIDLVTSRALAITPRFLDLFSRHSPGVRFLLWRGAEMPTLPSGIEIQEEIWLTGSRWRRILELGPKIPEANPRA